MARKPVERQLRLFPVGELGCGGEGQEDCVAESSGDDPWGPVMEDLGRFLGRGNFADYLRKALSAAEGADD